MSYHFPLILETNIESVKELTGISQVKIELTPEMLNEKYNIIINNELATSEEIDQAIRYIMALRIMKTEGII